MFLTRKKVFEFLERGNVITKDQVKMLVPFDSVAVKLTQSSTNAPSQVVLQNNISESAPVLAYSNVGVYTLKMTGKFTLGKTLLPTNSSKVKFTHTDVDTITINTYSGDLTTAANGVLVDYPVEIKVYD